MRRASAGDVDRLLDHMRPPVEGGDEVDWPRWRERLGFDFPSDYKRFMEIYGAGTVEEMLELDPHHDPAGSGGSGAGSRSRRDHAERSGPGRIAPGARRRPFIDNSVSPPPDIAE